MTKEKCPDQIVGEFVNFKLIGENKKEKRKEITKTYLVEKPRIMCVILESPHIDEYDKYGNAVGPAMGDTGDRFFKYFEKTVMKSKIYKDLKGNYDIIFMNAVQNQASEGQPLNNYKAKLKRDNNWLSYWNNGAKDDFIERLKTYQPEVIVDLCTIGILNLRSFVEMAIDKYIKDINTFRTYGYHPCTWLREVPPKNFGETYIK